MALTTAYIAGNHKSKEERSQGFMGWMIEFALVVSKISPPPTGGGAGGGMVVEAGIRAVDTPPRSPDPEVAVDEAAVGVKFSHPRLSRIAPHSAIDYMWGVSLML